MAKKTHRSTLGQKVKCVDIDIMRTIPSSRLPGGKGGLAKEELLMIYHAAVRIGAPLKPEARPYYVACLVVLSGIDQDLWHYIGGALGVRNFTAAQKLCATLFVAGIKGDVIAAGAFPQAMAGAGAADLAAQAIAGVQQMGALLDEIILGKPGASPTGATLQH
jgi:hypothetical protein